MKIIINEVVTKKIFDLYQRLIDKELSELKERYRNEEINSSNWYLSSFSHINKVKVINLKLRPSLSLYIDVYTDLRFDEDDAQNFASYLRDKLNFTGVKWIVPTLINNHKEDDIITENQSDKLINKIKNAIDSAGLFTTIKMVGGYDKFNTILPEYFKSRTHKIELINELIEKDTEGRIYLEEIGEPIIIGVEEVNDGHILNHHLEFVERDIVSVTVWEYNDGEIIDVPWDRYELSFEELEKSILDKIYKVMVNYYLR